MLLRQRSAPSSVPPPDPPILKVVSKILEIDQDLKLFRNFETVKIDLDKKLFRNSKIVEIDLD